MFGRLLNRKPFADIEPINAEMFSECPMDVSHSPDFIDLRERKTVLMFVYCEMMKRHPSNDLLAKSEWKATAYTRSKFTMVKNKLGKHTFPIPLESQYSTTEYCRVKGELWAVQPKDVFAIDKHKLNGVQFTRKRIPILIPHRILEQTDKGLLPGEERVVPLSVWAYVGNHDYWHTLLDGGYEYGNVATYIPKKTQKIGQYSYFSNKEYSV